MFFIIFFIACVNFQTKNTTQINSFGHIEYSDTIVWNPTYKLKWDDFKSTKFDSAIYSYLDSTKYVALAYSRVDISLKLRFEKNKPFVDSYAIFVRSQSWSGDSSSKGLLHEQGHFDMAELYARKFNVEMLQYQDLKLIDFLDLMYKKFNQMREEFIKESKNYDMETLSTIGLMFYIKRIQQGLDSLPAK